MITRVLRRGMRGDDVAEWQLFLIGQRCDPGLADGAFGGDTLEATCQFQGANNLTADGVVGRNTITCALSLGLGSVPDPENTSEKGPNFPPPPDFHPASLADRQAMFGKFAFVPDPKPGNREQIRITDGWDTRNIVSLTIPQLAGKKGAPASGAIRCHRLAADQIAALFAAWERARLLDRVLTWDGCYNPRFVRGSQTSLSNHAFGSAFDINAQWNGYGAEPARVGKQGSVRELVEIANDLGFFWGGHYAVRLDGMHFEIAELREVERGLAAPRALDPLARSLAPCASEAPAPADLTGTRFFEQIQSMVGPPREQAIHDAVTGGAVPPFLRAWQEIQLSACSRDGKSHTGVVRVLPDYLAVGSDFDFLRVPMNPMTAQLIANAYGCVLPTKKLVDLIHAQSCLKLTPQAMQAGPEMTSSTYYKRHNDRVEAQRAGRATGQLIAGHKKDVVITNRLLQAKNHVAIYGWQYPSGAPIQPLSTVHDDLYADYSHGIRLVDGTMTVDGAEMQTIDVLADPLLNVLLSDEGPLAITAYPIHS